MTRRTNARVAGYAYLVYIASALTGMVLSGRAAGTGAVPEKLARIAQHVVSMRLAFALELVGGFCALVLAVTLYSITREEDADLALLGMVCRVAEGVIGAVSLPRGLGKLWLATGADQVDPAAAAALGAYLFKLPTWNSDLGATFFAVGSTIFSCLLLRGRIVPAGMAWLGVAASALVLVLLPLQITGIVGRPITDAMWFPMLAFELALALWLIVKGAAVPRGARTIPPA